MAFLKDAVLHIEAYSQGGILKGGQVHIGGMGGLQLFPGDSAASTVPFAIALAPFMISAPMVKLMPAGTGFCSPAYRLFRDREMDSPWVQL